METTIVVAICLGVFVVGIAIGFIIRKMVSEAKIGSAIVILEDIKDEIQNKKRDKFDFVFIDANKKEYIEYFKIINKITTDNSVILADNILSHYEKTKDYTEELFENKNYQSQIINIGSGMMLSKRIANGE